MQEGGRPTESKRELRAGALKRRRAIGRAELAELSSRVEANLLGLEEYGRARMLISYCAKDDEVQTRPIIEKALAGGKRVAVVSTDTRALSLSFSEIASFQDDLAPGAFGILEPRRDRLRPVPLDEADLILVPVVAWDEEGRRLGYGAGYFDRALGGSRIPKVGLALESQRLREVPESGHDVRLDVIVTERRVVRPGRGAPARLDPQDR